MTLLPAPLALLSISCSSRIMTIQKILKWSSLPTFDSNFIQPGNKLCLKIKLPPSLWHCLWQRICLALTRTFKKGQNAWKTQWHWCTLYTYWACGEASLCLDSSLSISYRNNLTNFQSNFRIPLDQLNLSSTKTTAKMFSRCILPRT